MIIRKYAGRKMFSALIVAVMVMTLMSTCFILNAGAVNSGVNVGSYGTDKNSVFPLALQQGEVWTGKIVTDSAQPFGDGAKGRFGIKLLALGGAIDGDMPIIETGAQTKMESETELDGLVISDTYDSNYAFIFDNDKIPFYINGDLDQKFSAELQLDGTYTTDGEGWSVVFDPTGTNSTVRFKIDGWALELLGLSESFGIRSLEFGLLLKDTAASPTTYRTNLDDSCIAEFRAIQNNPHYWSNTTETRYTNTDSIFNWEKLDVSQNSASFGAGPFDISLLYQIGIGIETEEEPYLFTKSDSEIFYVSESNGSGWERLWKIGIKSGVYYKNGDLLKVPATSEVPSGYGILEHIWPPEGYDPADESVIPPKLFHQTSPMYGQLQKGELIVPDNAKFIVNTLPTGAGTKVSVTIVDTDQTFEGSIAAADYTSPAAWTFYDGSTQITLVDEYTLSVVSDTGHWNYTTDESYVKQTHDAYGYVTLTVPYNPPVIATSTLSVNKNVTGVNPSASEKFAITVVFTPGDAPNNNQVGGITASNGVINDNGKFKLNLAAADGAVTFSNIPVGTKYAITEAITDTQKADNWSGPAAAITGTVDADGVSEAVVNDKAGVQGTFDVSPSPSPSPSSAVLAEKDTDLLPTTGGISYSTLLGIFGFAIIAIGGTAFTIFRKKFLS